MWMPKVWSALGGFLDEIVLALGLALVTVGLWTICGMGALAVPGAVLVWMALPQRKTFVERLPVGDERRGRRD